MIFNKNIAVTQGEVIYINTDEDCTHIGIRTYHKAKDNKLDIKGKTVISNSDLKSNIIMIDIPTHIYNNDLIKYQRVKIEGRIFTCTKRNMPIILADRYTVTQDIEYINQIEITGKLISLNKISDEISKLKLNAQDLNVEVLVWGNYVAEEDVATNLIVNIKGFYKGVSSFRKINSAFMNICMYNLTRL